MDVFTYFSQGTVPSPVRLSLSETTEARAAARSLSPPPPPSTSSLQGISYADSVRSAEKELQLQETYKTIIADDFDELGSDVTDVDSIPIEDNSFLAFEKFPFKKNKNITFPIDELKSQILSNIESNPVTIIEGPTGCGKTTQVPQWILEDCFNNRRSCNIVVTQPRRIAAICVAKRVCEENCYRLGDLIGYQIGLERKSSLDTRLTYVTTGVLLQHLVGQKSLRQYTHIILDEVHERGKDMDFLLLIVRKLLRTNSKGVKVILMSATFNINKFAEYFAIPTFYGMEKNTVISLSSASVHPVGIYYLNELSKIGEIPDLSLNSPTITNEGFELTCKLLNAFEQIDLREECDKHEDDQRPCVLIFLPGLAQIEELFNILNTDSLRAKIDSRAPLHKWWIVPLHSTITTDEQIKAFRKPPAGYRKIILATDIAESSITVTDIKYVIDFCLNKILVCNLNTNFSSLQLCWASKTNCKQRAGRAGRVRVGRVYRLVPSDFYEQFSEECKPEMQRCSLENLILSAKILNIGSPKYLLALAMDPPDLTNIQQTILSLKEIGALYKTLSGKISFDDGDITNLGRIMGKLPLDVKISKLIVLGHIFGCLEDCIIIGAALSIRNIFSNPFLKKMSAFHSKLTWAFGSTSDCLSFLNVYRVYKSSLQQNSSLSTREGLNGWSKSMFLQSNAIKELVKLVDELKRRLAIEGIEEPKQPQSSLWTKTELILILKIILAGAFYPHYFIIGSQPENNERETAKILNGKDPCNTVYLTNMDNQQPGILYSSQIKNMFDFCNDSDLEVNFDTNSRKIFVTFPQRDKPDKAAIPGKVSLPVFLSVKMKQLRTPLNLRVMPLDKAIKHAKKLGVKTEDNYLMSTNSTMLDKAPKSMLSRLPGIDESYITLNITSMVNCGHFWARIADKSTTNEMITISETLNRDVRALVQLTSEPIIGRIYAAPYKENENDRLLYYRARIENFLPDKSVAVFFIDYGNGTNMAVHALRDFGIHTQKMIDIRPLAFECVLSEIAPSLIKDQRGLWTRAANELFLKHTHNKILHAKIFSVVNSVVSLELLDGNVNINEMLQKEGFGEVVEESYASKLNRDLRHRACDMQPNMIKIHNEQQTIQNIKKYETILAPKESECTRTINLKGPFSPLETNVHSLFSAGNNKSIHVEWDSVNSVLLNTDPQDQNDRLMVAACIHESSYNNSYNIRNTTLMPNIPGLTALTSLIFCPTAELRCNDDFTKYTGVLCGLGHINGKALYPEHDMFININVDIDNEDLEKINCLRLLINYNLTISLGEVIEHSGNLESRNKTPTTINKLIKKILLRQRKTHEFVPMHDGWCWGSVKNELKNYESDSNIDFIMEQLAGIELQSPSSDTLQKLARENKKLHDISISGENTSHFNIQCRLCGTGVLNLESLRLHLYSRMHRDHENTLPDITNE